MLGVINVLKPTGLTSSDVVVRVRSYLREYYGEKDIKVGHLGTLDPAGSGVLPIVFGKATRLFDYCVKDTKKYRVCFKFGITTDTLDSDGVVTGQCDVLPTLADIEASLGSFVGEIQQMPPQYSSISVGGVKSYKAARQGVALDIKPRVVSIYSIDILSYDGLELWLDVECGGGTYMRSLCRDIAASVGTIAYMPCIVRLENKGLVIEESVILDDVKNALPQCILGVEKFINDIDSYELAGDEAIHLLNGIAVPCRNNDGDYYVYIEGKLFGICRDNDGNIEVVVRLWE